MTDKSLSLWDSRKTPPTKAWIVYTWDGYRESEAYHSLFCYVENHAERLRQKYLAWIHELGETSINGKRIIDHLALADGLSYWWLTRFAEKNYSKSPEIHDAIRLLALEEILKQQGLTRVRLVSANRRLHKVLRDLCRELNIEYRWDRIDDSSPNQEAQSKFYYSLPQPIHALCSLVKFLKIRWPFAHAGAPSWFDNDTALFFCSYFENFNLADAGNGRFHSNYWAGLQDWMKWHGWRGNWIHRFTSSNSGTSPREALNFLDSFNRMPQVEGAHAFVESSLSYRILLRVLWRWINLLWVSSRMRSISDAFRPRHSHLNLWPLFEKDWRVSISGPDAILNLLEIECFDAALSRIPPQRQGVYLCENQAWERAFIHAWKKHKHGKLIAVIHSTVRFWDLRYFDDLRTVSSTTWMRQPKPDYIAVNGKPAYDACIAVGYPKDFIIPCEALRYLYLADLKPKRALPTRKQDRIRVLLLGDFVQKDTSDMLLLIQGAALLSPNLAIYTIKPHPNCPVRGMDWPQLNLRIVTTPIENLLQDCDVVCSSSKTSAALDAYLSGLPVVITLDESMLNLSPLRGLSGVRFVSTSDEMVQAIQGCQRHSTERPNCGEFFFLDSGLEKWTHILIV